MYFEAAELRLKVGTGWTEITLTSEVGVVPTRRGYVPAVQVDRGATSHLMLVGAISLAGPLEVIRARDGSLVGKKLRIRKTAETAMSPYEVEERE